MYLCEHLKQEELLGALALRVQAGCNCRCQATLTCVNIKVYWKYRFCIPVTFTYSPQDLSMTKWGDFGSEPGLAGDTEAVLAYLTYIML